MGNTPTEKKTDYNVIGLSLAQYGRHREAIEKFKKAVDSNPDDHNVYFNYGLSLLKL